MAGHRSPRGERAPWYAEAIGSADREPARRRSNSRHSAGQRSNIAGPSLRTTVLASAAAAGAVATGTFSALVPSGDGAASAASADESPIVATLAANSARLDVHTANFAQGGGYFTPVSLSDDGSSDDGDDGGAAGSDQHLALLGKAADIAAQLAQQHQAEAERARIDALIDKGGLDGWIAEALHVLNLPQNLAPSVKKIIMAESGGNPRAINTWDANAQRGTPSQGLMQTIPVTFRKYVDPSLAGRPITDPVANITAGVRYMIENYGMSTLQAGGRTNSSGGYVGY